MKNIYIIGGSSCSGKSTVSKVLEEKNNLFYFKVDDCLEEYTNRGKSSKDNLIDKISTYFGL